MYKSPEFSIFFINTMAWVTAPAVDFQMLGNQQGQTYVILNNLKQRSNRIVAARWKMFRQSRKYFLQQHSPQDELIDLERYTGAISDIFTQEIPRNSPVQFYISRNEKLINVLNYWNWSINKSSHFLPCWLICRKHWEKWLRFSG